MGLNAAEEFRLILIQTGNPATLRIIVYSAIHFLFKRNNQPTQNSARACCHPLGIFSPNTSGQSYFMVTFACSDLAYKHVSPPPPTPNTGNSFQDSDSKLKFFFSEAHAERLHFQQVERLC